MRAPAPAPTPAPTPTLNSAGVPIFVNGLGEVPIEQIEVNPNQPRKYFDSSSLDELTASIEEFGVLQPITVRKVRGGFLRCNGCGGYPGASGGLRSRKI